ncbi:hypothetical protein M433DRAFT_485988 [Acidomyces richmondensis BFW]|nr:hypothetical protein M433DRAFT_485988 [Acidomyces richmondensis BFW]
MWPRSLDTLSWAREFSFFHFAIFTRVWQAFKSPTEDLISAFVTVGNRGIAQTENQPLTHIPKILNACRREDSRAVKSRTFNISVPRRNPESYRSMFVTPSAIPSCHDPIPSRGLCRCFHQRLSVVFQRRQTSLQRAFRPVL